MSGGRPLSHCSESRSPRNPTEKKSHPPAAEARLRGERNDVKNLKLWSSFAAAVLMAGCAVGPDFQHPQAPDVGTYTGSPLSEVTVSAPGTAGRAQRLTGGADIPAQWWTLFHSPALDQLIRQALVDSPTLEAAEAALRQSQEQANAFAGSAFYPKLDAKALVSRQKISGAAFGQPNVKFNPFTLFNASVDVTYALDIFGGSRRELEALGAEVDYQRFQLQGAHIALTANIVTAAIRDAALRAELMATRQIATAQEEQLGIVERQFEIGATTKTDVLLQRGRVAQTKASLAPLEKTLAQTRHQLAVLAGKLPSEASALPEFSLDAFELPEDLPVSLPSTLVRQRPDIRVAESILHAASAQIGVATANLYPQITLSGTYGSTAESTSSLFSGGSSVWNMAAGLTQPLFHGGALRAERRAAIAAYDGAAANYRQAVLQAFQNVADVLRALELDAQALKAQAEAESAARDSLETSRKQFQIGATNNLTVLLAESQYEEARIGLVQAQATRFADTAALYQALGGGWWNEEENAGKGNAEKGAEGVKIE
jgi:NodT family efflux transporter outer membrane factor (OMF) lipoprotein